jgi:hypothetical protein
MRETSSDEYRAVWALRLSEVQELAAERPAHARYLAALLETDPEKPWTLEQVRHSTKVSARVADALREDASTYRPTDGRDSRQWPPLRSAYADIRALAENERDPFEQRRRAANRSKDLFRSYRIPPVG